MGVIRLFFPPFYKYPVILFAGFNLIFSAVVLSVSEGKFHLACKYVIRQILSFLQISIDHSANCLQYV